MTMSMPSSPATLHFPNTTMRSRWLQITFVVVLTLAVLAKITHEKLLVRDPSKSYTKPDNIRTRKEDDSSSSSSISDDPNDSSIISDSIDRGIPSTSSRRKKPASKLRPAAKDHSGDGSADKSSFSNTRTDPKTKLHSHNKNSKKGRTSTSKLTDSSNSSNGHKTAPPKAKPDKEKHSHDNSAKGQTSSFINPSKNRPTVSETQTNSVESNNNGTLPEFVDQWCQLQGLDWYPSREENQWQYRAPYFLLPGAKMSGTTHLASYLEQHPLVEPARTQELGFFLPKHFRPYVSATTGKTSVKSARQVMYARDYPRKRQLQNNSSLVSFDATPSYLFYSATLPQQVLCVCPWVKLVVVLRNPIDRAYANYQLVVQRANLQLSFEEWIDNDVEYMTQAGLLHNWNRVNFDAFAGSDQENEAWDEYTRIVSEGPIGRGMYEIQVRQWFQAFKSIGRDPQTEILIVRYEDVERDANVEYNRIVDFLGLPQQHKLAVPPDRMASNSKTMDTSTRQMLEDFYAPYNRRLYEFLGGGDWEGYWDPALEAETTS